MKTINHILYIGFVISFILIYTYANYLASFSYPIPWPDEGYFLWQAISFARNNSLVSPELNPNRPVFPNPPGYMIIVGIIFKITGFSFCIARKLSLVFMVLFFIVFTLMTHKYELQLVTLTFCGLFFISEVFVVIGNVARMEALVLLVVGLGFLLLQNKMYIKGIALLSVGPLIHPNGLYFVIAAFIYFVFNRQTKIENIKVNKTDWFFILISIFLWLCFIVYVGINWEHFSSDISFLLKQKLERGDLIRNLLSENNFLTFLLFIFCLKYGIKEQIPSTFLLSIGIPAWFINKVGKEMWYSIYNVLSYLVLSIVLLQITRHIIINTTKSKVKAYLCIALTAIYLIFWHCKVGRIENLNNYPFEMNWSEMAIQQEIPYIKDSDIEKIREFLNTYNSRNEPIYIQFFPGSDSLFFHDIEGDVFRLSQPLFFGRQPDILIVHMSKYMPEWWLNITQKEISRTGVDSIEEMNILFQRDDSERWYYHLFLNLP